MIVAGKIWLVHEYTGTVLQAIEGVNLVTLHPWYVSLRQSMVVDPTMNDPRETRRPGTRLGWPTSWIFNTAIGGGQADFDKPIENLTPRDRAMLYAFFNQKGHIEELIHAFGKLWPDPTSIHGTMIIDVGCGPFTGGLALANIVGDAAKFRYFGVDRAKSMCELGQELAQGARDAGALHSQTEIQFVAELDQLPVASLCLEPIVIVLSYLLASDTLNVDEMFDGLLRVFGKKSLSPVSVLYTNTARADARKKYPQLRQRLVEAEFQIVVEAEETLTEGSKARSVHYALFHRPAPAELSMSIFKP